MDAMNNNDKKTIPSGEQQPQSTNHTFSASHPFYPYPMKEPGLNLRELVKLMWRYKLLIIATTFVAAVIAVIIALALPNIFEAEAKIAPTEESQSNGLAGMAGQLGGLASMAGVNLGRGQLDKASMALEVLRSRRFITEFVENREILPDLMAVDYWNRTTGELVYDPEIYDASSGTWVREVEAGQNPEPSAWEYVRVFRENFSITRDDALGTVLIRIQHRSPIVAKQWVNWLIEDLNNEMRRRDITEARKSLQYLEAEMESTVLTRMQQIFYQLMEKQTQTIMLANVRPEYVFQVIDPAVVPEQRKSPRRSIIAIVGTILGGFLGVLIVLLIQVFREPVE